MIGADERLAEDTVFLAPLRQPPPRRKGGQAEQYFTHSFRERQSNGYIAAQSEGVPYR